MSNNMFKEQEKIVFYLDKDAYFERVLCYYGCLFYLSLEMLIKKNVLTSIYICDFRL